MNIPNRVVTAISRSAEGISAKTLKRGPLDYAPHLQGTEDPERIARRFTFMSGGGAKPSARELERVMGTNDLVDEFYLERALLAALPVCRIGIRDATGHERGSATGFMISPRLMITNHHVFGSAKEAEPSIAEFNYRYNVAGRPEPSFRFKLRPDVYFFNHQRLDFAVVAVDPKSEDGATELRRFGYHRLIPERGKTLLKEWMNIIQHPGGSRRQFAMRENQCVKDDDPDVLWYVSDTAQGSSGSPVFNDSFQVVALHHAGVPRREGSRIILKSGKTVADLADADDADVDWVANAGIRVSRICKTLNTVARERNGCLAEWKASQENGDVLSSAYARAGSSTRVAGAPLESQPAVAPAAGRIVLGSLVLEVASGGLALLGSAPLPAPLAPVISAPAVTAGSDSSSASAESLKEPIIDRNYASRRGFDPNFLGIATPLPTITKTAVVAPMLDGRKIIPYEHFSVVLHKTRKLAIYTASNVDGRAAVRRPEPNKKYSRKDLTGLDDNDQEKWVLDARVSPEFQIPDSFYTRDNGTFDKGHIVRREDVCFGTTHAQIQRANGDTFHVTNCSPQRGNYNRSNLGGIWGGLENFIGAQADTEQFCIFAGPVLADSDLRFGGTPVQIPTRFWKVVCAVKARKLQVFAFMLEQDLRGVPLEFQVDARWRQQQVKLKALESMVGLVKFPKAYHTADQATA
ncbi:DNA/RNA non-specific endonuclease [Horticoccus sp. 23ND18S-11]|uniref:DNA/RNA non-specific endonuclease n=1 Tax=Horticoccus sp. 23ND18S-11 TaxID=3391832 RepID=UPI0039C97EBD